MATSSDPYAQPGDSAAGAEALREETLEVVDHEQSEGFELQVPAAPKVFYGLDSRNVSTKDIWQGTRGGEFPLIFLITKVLRIPVPGSPEDPAVHSLDAFVVPRQQVPAPVLMEFATRAQQLATLGFVNPVYHTIDDTHHKTRMYYASYSNLRLPVVARLVHRFWEGATPPRVWNITEFITKHPGFT